MTRNTLHHPIPKSLMDDHEFIDTQILEHEFDLWIGLIHKVEHMPDTFKRPEALNLPDAALSGIVNGFRMLDWRKTQALCRDFEQMRFAKTMEGKSTQWLKEYGRNLICQAFPETSEEDLVCQYHSF